MVGVSRETGGVIRLELWSAGGGEGGEAREDGVISDGLVAEGTVPTKVPNYPC